MKKILFLLFTTSLLTTLILTGCASRKIKRTDVRQQIDLSGKWNDTDSRLTSEAMIADALKRPWIGNFQTENEVKPRIIVGKVINKSLEHINTETFTKDLERALINSGRVRFVADSTQRGELREERLDQGEHSRPDTAKQFGQEYGADFLLKGQINMITDAADNEQVRYYQIELELIDIESNEKAWIGQNKVKKYIKYKKTRL